MPTPTATRMHDALAGVVGKDALITDPGRLVVYESDALTRYRSRPAGVVLPASTAEVAEVVRILSEAGVPMVARGAGTGLSGGAVAGADAYVIGLSRMNRILELDGRRRLARVEAGVVNVELSRRTAPLGLHYAPDPSSQTACTLGGNVAENSGGPHCLKYGVTTRYVTGLTVVLADGRVAELGGADRRDPLDLTGLVVGSEGCFGIVTEIEVRLLPRPETVRTLLAVFDTPARAGAAVSAIVARGLLPAALEIIDRATIEAVEASAFAAGYPTGAGAALVVEFDGVEAGIDAECARAAAICTEFDALEVRSARTETERTALWQGRKKAFGAMGRIAPDLMVQDATVPRSVLPDVLERIAEIGVRYDLRIANVFHAGDGNLHPNILFDRRDAEQTDRVEAASHEIMRVCVDAGGTITGEHGVGLDKRHYMSLVHGPAEIAAMRAVRRAFDPRELLNPGKVLPDEDPEAAATAGSSRMRGGSGGTSVSAPGVLEYRPADLTITVEGSMPWEEVSRVTGASGQWVPWAGERLAGATVADVLSAGGWSPFAEKYGGLRDLVLGARILGAHGPLTLGGRVVKNVAGFDLLRPVIGSGLDPARVEHVTFRLYPLPAAARTVRMPVPPEVEAGALHAAVRELPVLPAAALLADDGIGREVLARFDGSEDEVEFLVRRFEGALAGSGIGSGADPRVPPVEGEGEHGIEALVAELGGIPGGPRAEAGTGPAAGPRVSAGPGPATRPELFEGLLALLSDDAEERLVIVDLSTDRIEATARSARLDDPRWVGLARRYAEAGGELRVDRMDGPLPARLGEVASGSPARLRTRELAASVRDALLGGVA